MNKVSVVIVSYNVKNDLVECLQSLNKTIADGFVFSIIVVDNNSQDSSSEVVKKLFPNIILIENSQNFGFARGNNIGIQKAIESGANYILLLNPDTLVDKHLISHLLQLMEKDLKIGIVGPKIYFASGFEFHQNKYQKKDLGKIFWYAGGILDKNNALAFHRGIDEIDNGQYDQIKETDFVSGCAMFIRKEVFDKIGFLDEKYFLYLEDLDFCQRAKKAGFKVIYAPLEAVWHKNARSSSLGSPLQDYYISRNRMLFARQHLSLRTKVALMRQAFKNIFIESKRKALIDFLVGNFGKGSY